MGALVLALAAACGEAETGRRASTGDATAAREDAPGAAPAVVTEGDDGSTFELRVGASAALRLSSGAEWQAPSVDGRAVELSPVDYLQDSAFRESQVQAVEPGKASVGAADATGRRFEVVFAVGP